MTRWFSVACQVITGRFVVHQVMPDKVVASQDVQVMRGQQVASLWELPHQAVVFSVRIYNYYFEGHQVLVHQVMAYQVLGYQVVAYQVLAYQIVT